MRAPSKKTWLFFGLFLVYFLYFFRGIDSVGFTYWDEPYYVNASRTYLTSHKPYANPEHPPLAKELMALSISLRGDNPVGWRLLSVLCGALTCTLISYLVFRWTQNLGVAFFLAFLLPLDPMLVVNFRMALLEAPLMAALMGATALAYGFLQEKSSNLKTLYLWGIAAGIAWAVKFNTLVFFPVWWGLALYTLKKQQRSRRVWIHAGLALGLLPPVILFLSYAVLGYTPREFFELLSFMWNYHRVHKGPSLFVSRWYDWIWIKDPIWYFIRVTGPTKIQGVMLTGNLVLWIGALVALFYLLVRKFRQPVFWLFALPIFFQILLYARKPSTYFYYMMQILPYLYLMLGGALGDLWQRWGKRYGTLLKVDFALFWIGAAILFGNYWPFLWGQPFSRAAYQSKTGQILSQSPVPASSGSAEATAIGNEPSQGNPE